MIVSLLLDLLFLCVFFVLLFCCMSFVSSVIIFFFNQKTAYDMRISDWSSDVCSSDLGRTGDRAAKAVPLLKVRRLVTGLDHPWDVRPIGAGRLIFTKIGRAVCWERV